jgi:hypothetical protein
VKHAYDVQARDDSAWPRGAIPISLVAGLATVVGGGIVVGKASNGWLTGLGLLMGLAIAALIIVLGIRRWLTGARFPIGLIWVMTGVAIVGSSWYAATGLFGAGGAFLLGLGAGCLFANIWAVRAARRNRRSAAL